jgi:hypothetical protein
VHDHAIPDDDVERGELVEDGRYLSNLDAVGRARFRRD